MQAEIEITGVQRKIPLNKIIFDRTNPHIKNYIQVRAGDKDGKIQQAIFRDIREGYDHTQDRVAVEPIAHILSRPDCPKALKKVLTEDPRYCEKEYLVADGNHRLDAAWNYLQDRDPHKKPIPGIKDFLTKGEWPVEVFKFPSLLAKCEFQDERNRHAGKTHNKKTSADDVNFLAQTLTFAPESFGAALEKIHNRRFHPFDTDALSWLNKLSQKEGETVLTAIENFLLERFASPTWARYSDQRCTKTDARRLTKLGNALKRDLQKQFGVATTLVCTSNREVKDACQAKFEHAQGQYALTGADRTAALKDGYEPYGFVHIVSADTLGVAPGMPVSEHLNLLERIPAPDTDANAPPDKKLYWRYNVVVHHGDCLTVRQLDGLRKSVLTKMVAINKDRVRGHGYHLVDNVWFCTQTAAELKNYPVANGTALFSFDRDPKFANIKLF